MPFMRVKNLVKAAWSEKYSGDEKQCCKYVDIPVTHTYRSSNAAHGLCAADRIFESDVWTEAHKVEHIEHIIVTVHKDNLEVDTPIFFAI